jgi:hypothetical protein
MKKTKRKSSPNGLRPEYDFSGGVHGKYAGSIRRKAAVVVLEPDVARVFKTSESVNAALRALVAIERLKRGKRTS